MFKNKMFVSLILIFTMIFGVSIHPTFAAEKLDKAVLVEINASDGRSEKIFSEDESVSFSIRYKALGTFGGATEAVTSVKNSAGENVGEPLSFTLRFKRNIVMKNLELGYLPVGKYIVETTMTYLGTEYSHQDEFCVTAFGEDSVVDMECGILGHFTTDWTEHKLEEMALMKKAGFGTVRCGLGWGQVETETKGNYNIPEKYIAFLDEAERLGLDVLCTLGGYNELYSESGYTNGMPSTTNSLDGFAGYCDYVAGTIGDRIKYYEIYNEPDLQLDANGNTMSMYEKISLYVSLVNSAAPAIRNGDSDGDCYIIAGSAASIIDTGSSDKAKINTKFISGILPFIKDKINAVSIHPYHYLAASVLDEAEHDFNTMMDKVSSIAGDSLDIWITETGYGSVDYSIDKWGITLSMNQEKQGAYDVRTQILSKADGRIKKCIKYDMKNDRNKAESAGYVEDNFGILERSGEPKEAYYMLAAKNAALVGTKTTGKSVVNMDSNYNGYSIYNFSGDEKEVYALWANGSNTYELNVTAQGSEFSAAASGGNLSLVIPESSLADGRIIKIKDAYGTEVTDNVMVDFKPLYVVIEKPSEENGFFFDVKLEDGVVTLSGKTEEANEDVCYIAKDISSDKIISVGQIKSGDSRNFKTTFSIGEEMACFVLIGGDGLIEEALKDYMITFIQNEKETSFNELTCGDVTVNGKIGRSLEDNSCAYIVQRNGAVVSAEKVEIDENGEFSVNFNLKEINDDIFNIELFLWGNNLLPETKKIDLSE